MQAPDLWAAGKARSTFTHEHSRNIRSTMGCHQPQHCLQTARTEEFPMEMIIFTHGSYQYPCSHHFPESDVRRPDRVL